MLPEAAEARQTGQATFFEQWSLVLVEGRFSSTTEIVWACWLGSGLLLAMTFVACPFVKFKAIVKLRALYL